MEREVELFIRDDPTVRIYYSDDDIAKVIANLFAKIFLSSFINDAIHYIEINGEYPEDWSESYWEEEDE